MIMDFANIFYFFNEFSYFTVVYLMRTYVYAYQYFMSQRRAGRDQRHSWMANNQWIIANKTLVLGYFILFIIYEAPPIITGEIYAPVWTPEKQNCVSNPLGYVRWVMLASLLIPVVVIVFILRTSKDAFHIKTEMKILTVTWVLIIIPYGVITEFYTSFDTRFLVSVILYVIGHAAAFCTHTVWVYILSIKSDKIAGIAQKLNTLTVSTLVSDGRLRQLLFDFLTQSFCVENLLFWEDVQLWKQTEPGYLQHWTLACAIMEKYIMPGSPLEVNIESTTKLTIQKKYQEVSSMDINLELDTSIFDDAIAEIETLIIMHSYPQFKEFHKNSQLPI